MNAFTPSALAKKLNVSTETLRLWADQGKIKSTKTPGGHRRYLYGDQNSSQEKLRFIYARVSSKKQQSDLTRQIDFLQKKYPDYKTISDIGSGINFHRKGLIKILEALFNGSLEEVVVAHKDRLCRYGFDLFEFLFKHFSATLTVVHNTDSESENDELAEDLLSIVTVFTARFHGRKKYSKSEKDKKKCKNTTKK